jgi:hypothetical protein
MPGRYQSAAAKVYGYGDYAYITEPDYTNRHLASDLADHAFGDTLFNFVMLELDENDVEDLDDAKNRMDRAIADLQLVRAALDEME